MPRNRQLVLVSDGRIRGRGIGADAAGLRQLTDRVETRVLSGQAGEIDFVAQFAAHHRLTKHAVIIQHRQDNRNLALLIDQRKAVVINRAQIEITAIAAPDQVKLRNAFGARQVGADQRIDGAGSERIEIVAVKPAQIVVEDKGRIGNQNSGPAPYPFVGEVELAGRYRNAAEGLRGGGVGAVTRRKVTGIQLVNAGGLDRVIAAGAACAPSRPPSANLVATYRWDRGSGHSSAPTPANRGP